MLMRYRCKSALGTQINFNSKRSTLFPYKSICLQNWECAQWEGDCLYWTFASSEPTKSDSCPKLGQIWCLHPDSVLTWIKQRRWVWLFISATCACQRQEAKILIYCGKHSRSQLMIHNPVSIQNDNIEHRTRHWFHFWGKNAISDSDGCSIVVL